MVLPMTGRFGWDPFAEVRRMQADMDRLLGGAMVPPATAGFPPINIWLADDGVGLGVTMELPGVRLEDLDVSVREATLTLQGRRDAPAEPDTVSWHRRERRHGSFSRSIALPIRVDADQVEAQMVDGILKLTLRRPQADLPRRIQIRAA